SRRRRKIPAQSAFGEAVFTSGSFVVVPQYSSEEGRGAARDSFLDSANPAPVSWIPLPPGKGTMDYVRGKIERGYTNTILRVDLTARTAAVRRLEPKVRNYFLGGRSLGLYLLHRAVTAATRPEDPENPLIVANG